MEKRLIIMQGLPGSGKSTYVRRMLLPQGVQVICPDALRKALGHNFYAPLESMVHATAELMVRSAMLQGLDVVIDACNCKAAYVRRWLRLTSNTDYTPSLVRIYTPQPLCEQRRCGGTSTFPLSVITSMAEDLACYKEQDESLCPDPILVEGY